MAEQMDRLLTQREVAEWIGMSEAWLEQCRFKKTGIPYVKIMRSCRYKESTIRSYIEANTICAGV